MYSCIRTAEKQDIKAWRQLQYNAYLLYGSVFDQLAVFSKVNYLECLTHIREM